jgi:hypothetical protein
VFANGGQADFVKRLPTPEQQLRMVFELAIADDRISIDEPDGVPVPDFAAGLRQMLFNCIQQELADLSITFW